MTKKNLELLIRKNKNSYHCLTINDATIVYGNPYYFIKIVWKYMTYASVLHTGKGSLSSDKAAKAKAKYQKWINQIIN